MLGTTAAFWGRHHNYFDVGIRWGVGHLDEGRPWKFCAVSCRWAGDRLALSLSSIFGAIFGAIFASIFGAIFGAIFGVIFGARLVSGTLRGST